MMRLAAAIYFCRQSLADWERGFLQAALSQLSPLLAGRITLIAANAVLILILAWRLPVETYGLFVTAVGAQVVISRILTVGVDIGIIRLSGVSSRIDAGIEEIYSAGLTATLVVSLIVAFTASAIWLVLPETSEGAWFLSSVIVGATGLALVDLAYAYRVARTQYGLAALTLGLSALFRLALTLTVTFLFPLQYWAVFVVYAAASAATGLIYQVIAARVEWHIPQWRIITQVVRYSAWSLWANLLLVINLYQGTFLLEVLKAKGAAGIFSFALALSMAILVIYTGFSDYVRSRVSHLSTPALLPGFILRWFVASSVLAACVVPVALVIGNLLPPLAGPQWAIAVAPFYYLAGAMMLQLLHSPFESACHYLLSPYLITYAYVIRFVSTGILGVMLAPSFGAVGAATAQLGGSAVSLLLLVVMLVFRMRAAGDPGARRITLRENQT